MQWAWAQHNAPTSPHADELTVLGNGDRSEYDRATPEDPNMSDIAATRENLLRAINKWVTVTDAYCNRRASFEEAAQATKVLTGYVEAIVEERDSARAEVEKLVGLLRLIVKESDNIVKEFDDTEQNGGLFVAIEKAEAAIAAHDSKGRDEKP